MENQHERKTTRAQALREMGTGEMAECIGNMIEEFTGMDVPYEKIRKHLEELTE